MSLQICLVDRDGLFGGNKIGAALLVLIISLHARSESELMINFCLEWLNLQFILKSQIT